MWTDEDPGKFQIGVDMGSGKDKSVQAIAARLYLEATQGPVVIALPPPPEGVDWEDYQQEWVDKMASLAMPTEILEQRNRRSGRPVVLTTKEEMYKELSEKLATGKIRFISQWL